MNEKGDFFSIQVKRTLPAQPWSNGLVERANGKIKMIISKSIQKREEIGLLI